MQPARSYPPRRDDVRLLVVDPGSGAFAETRTTEMDRLLGPRDLLVVNDAATVPASLSGRDEQGRPVEARLATWEPPYAELTFGAVLFGAGDWRQRTEDRPPPPDLTPGSRLRFGAAAADGLTAEVVRRWSSSSRLVTLRFLESAEAFWRHLFLVGKVVQYSYLAHELPLWAVQTVYASRPWAFEMPSAGRPLSWELLLRLRRKGIRVATLTHSAGLSSTGDPMLDAELPFPERFEIPVRTAELIRETRSQERRGRVIAVGTSVVRSLEGAAATAQEISPGAGVTELRIGGAHQPRIVDGVMTGIHVDGESHFQLLKAFARPALLAAASAYAERREFRAHELGDAMLVLPGSLPAAPPTRVGPAGARGIHVVR